MLPNEKNNLLYLLNILESIEKIGIYSKGTSGPEDFYGKNDQLNFNATLNLLANIGEGISKLTQELKNEYNEVNWQIIKNFRNKVVHNYMGIDMYIVYEIVKEDLKKLKHVIEKILKNKIIENVFDKEEMKLALDSIYYRHIDFKEIL